MAVNKGTNITGYVFPNIPGNWTQEERRFALALRGLFDALFQKTRGLDANYDKDSYDSLTDRPKIENVTLTGNKSLSDIGIKTVNDSRNGLMTPTMYEKLAGIEEGATNTPDIRYAVDYLSMMTQIDITTDTGDKVEKVTGYYPDLWDKGMVWDAVDKGWITNDDYEEITGEPFPPFRPDLEEEE